MPNHSNERKRQLELEEAKEKAPHVLLPRSGTMGEAKGMNKVPAMPER